MSRGTVRVFVHERGNVYMREIGELAVAGFREAGLDAELCTRGLPGRRTGTHDLVVAPHEYFLFESDVDPLGALEAARSVAVLNTEQPGTQWFELALEFCEASPLVFDLNAVGCAALRRCGIMAEEFRLGYCRDWDLLGGSLRDERPIDVVFMGAATAWRERVIADLAESLAQRTCRILFFDGTSPVPDGSSDFLSGRRKLELLASTRVLLNVHRAGTGHYFEWHRCLPALLNGAVLVSEPSASYDPLEPFADFLPLERDSIEGYLVALLDDEERRVSMAESAYRRLRSERPLSTSIESAFTFMRERLVQTSPVAPMPATRVRPAPDRSGSSLVAAEVRERLGSRIATPARTGLETDEYDPLVRVAHGVKRLLLEQRRLTAVLERVLRAAGAGVTGDDIVVTEHFEASAPDVSVVIPLFNHADFVIGAIDSALRSRGVAVEVVVVDDGSTDDSATVVGDAIRARPWARVKLVRHPENRGLAAARNTGFEHATCEMVFLLDADNEVYADGIARLYRALDGSESEFAYGILACFGDEQKLLSHYPWNVAQLCRRNYVDAMALVRKRLWTRIGGYSSGPNDVAYGWEDYQFWLCCAAAGVTPEFVPELVGRYRVRHGSMISITGIETNSVEEYLRRTFPTLPWPRDALVDEEVIV